MTRDYRARFNQIRGQIEKNYKFHGELRVQVQKLETKDQDENDAELLG